MALTPYPVGPSQSFRFAVSFVPPPGTDPTTASLSGSRQGRRAPRSRNSSTREVLVMGLEEKRKIKEFQDTIVPNRHKELAEITGGDIAYEVDWSGFADDLPALNFFD